MINVNLNTSEIEVLLSALQLIDENLIHQNDVSLPALYNKLYSVAEQLQEVYV
jgi:hypothetical protein